MGYKYTPGDLQNVAGQFRAAAHEMDGAAQAIPDAVDAGASSDVVAKALADFVAWSAAGAQHLDDIAGRIHATNGSYDQTENDNSAMLDPNKTVIGRAVHKTQQQNNGR